MVMKKKISNITLPFIVLLLGVIFLGMIGIGEDEVSINPSDADSITFRNIRNNKIGPSGDGAFLQNSPFINAERITPSGINYPNGNYYQQFRAPAQIPTRFYEKIPTRIPERIPNEGVWMGMEIEGLSAGTKRELGLKKNQMGVILDSVPPGSDAEKTGLRNGDIIRAINGQIIVNMADYIRATKNQKLNSAILEIERSGQFLTFSIPRQPTVLTGMTRLLPGSNNIGYNIDAYSSASPKFTRIINKKGIPPITLNSPLPHAYVGVCAKCHEINQGKIPLNLLNIPPNSQARSSYKGNFSLPSPAQQNAAHKVLVEGHWLGMELIPITPELARAYKLPAGVDGLLVDEVTLEAAESGLLAGDVLQRINNIPITSLKDFALATRKVESLSAVTLGVLRDGKPEALTLSSSWRKLGVAQNEAAQPIQPGAISPHKDMGRACTDCHIIMKNGGQLQTDAGDILPVPSPIRTDETAPHSYRGECNRCHVIIK